MDPLLGCNNIHTSDNFKLNDWEKSMESWQRHWDLQAETF